MQHKKEYCRNKIFMIMVHLVIGASGKNFNPEKIIDGDFNEW